MSKKVILIALQAFLVFSVVGASSAVACIARPSGEASGRAFRGMIEDADYIFVGHVSHILRRRWGDDDTRPFLHPKWLGYAEQARAGQDVGSNGYLVNWVEFAEATAFLSIKYRAILDRVGKWTTPSRWS